MMKKVSYLFNVFGPPDIAEKESADPVFPVFFLFDHKVEIIVFPALCISELSLDRDIFEIIQVTVMYRLD